MRRLATLALTLPLMAQAPVTVNVKDVNLKLGMLAQPMYESVGSPNPRLEGSTQNLFMRRFRILFGGSIGQDLEFFFETDNSDIGKKADTGGKANLGMALQDAFISYKLTKDIKIDAGLLLVPGSHQGTQGATTLYGVDYSPYAFAQTNAFGNRAGRDTGVMVRGLVGKLEFRAGAFQGRRSDAVADKAVASRNSLRVAARAQYNFFDVENGTFLSGTYLGAKKIFSIGAAVDKQDDYQSTALDAFLDWPMGSDTLTAQVNVVDWDGGDWLTKGLTSAFTPLAKQKTAFAEAGYRFGATKLSPYVRFETRSMYKPTSTVPDEKRTGLGLAWWFKGHTSNLKVYVQDIKPEAPGANLRSYKQANLQWQTFFF